MMIYLLLMNVLLWMHATVKSQVAPQQSMANPVAASSAMQPAQTYVFSAPQTGPIGFQPPAQMPQPSMQQPVAPPPFQQAPLPMQPQFSGQPYPQMQSQIPMNMPQAAPQTPQPQPQHVIQLPPATAQPQPMPQAPAQKPSFSVIQMAPIPGGILNPLRQNDADALSVDDKNKSDAVMTAGLREVAHTSYTVLSVDGKTFTSKFEAYLYTIKKLLIERVGISGNFKLRQELLDLIGQKDQIGGSLPQFADQRLKIIGSEVEFLQNVFQHFDDLLGQLTNFIKRCFFFDNNFNNEAQVYAATIFANIMCSQRTGVPSEAQKKFSDDAVHALIKNMNDAIERELRELNIRAVNSQTKIRLTKDYIIWLGYELNRMRVNPNFYKYNDPIVLLDMLACNKSIAAKHCKKLTVEGMYKDLAELLFYDTQKINEGIKQESLVLQAMINDHESRLQ